MIFRKQSRSDKLAVASIWFLAAACGGAYASSDGLGGMTASVSYDVFGFRPDAIASLGPAEADALRKIAAQSAANGAGANKDNIVLFGGSADLSDNRNIATEQANKRDRVAETLMNYNISDQGSQSVSDLDGIMSKVAEAEQANQDLFVAADNFGNALIYTIAAHYGRMKPEDAMAEFVAEAKRQGYLPGDDGVADKGLSLINKAYAASRQFDVSPVYQGGVGGVPPKLCRVSTQHPGFCDQAPSDDRTKQGAGIMVGSTAAYLVELQRCGATGTNREARSGSSVVEKGMMLGCEHIAGKELAELKDLANNAVMSSGGGSSDNSDHSSFLINAAHADGKVEVDSPAQNSQQTLLRKQEAAFKAWREVKAGNVGTPDGALTSWQAGCTPGIDRADSMSHLGQLAGSQGQDVKEPLKAQRSGEACMRMVWLGR